MYISVKVNLVSGLYAYEDWSCEIELSQKTSLRELNEIILNAVGFDNDHFSQFFISRREFGSTLVMIGYFRYPNLAANRSHS
ncbi:hypothetical protein [Vibrio vulnificus]|uniref:hypothetical protein n=1 Tax=Vibrio vulnificus TaxID=672 RepID=UPI0009B656A3|nr:hypothetical protein [Vibrio vulnificus]OQK56233.1 hypothetical protein XM77_c11645 [Vibrio vulnificus]